MAPVRARKRRRLRSAIRRAPGRGARGPRPGRASPSSQVDDTSATAAVVAGLKPAGRPSAPASARRSPAAAARRAGPSGSPARRRGRPGCSAGPWSTRSATWRRRASRRRSAARTQGARRRTGPSTAWSGRGPHPWPAGREEPRHRPEHQAGGAALGHGLGARRGQHPEVEVGVPEAAAEVLEQRQVASGSEHGSRRKRATNGAHASWDTTASITVSRSRGPPAAPGSAAGCRRGRRPRTHRPATASGSGLVRSASIRQPVRAVRRPGRRPRRSCPRRGEQLNSSAGNSR